MSDLIYDTWTKDPFRALSIAFEEAFDNSKSDILVPYINAWVCSRDITGKLYGTKKKVTELQLLYRQYLVDYHATDKCLVIIFTDVIFDPLSQTDIPRSQLLSANVSLLQSKF